MGEHLLDALLVGLGATLARLLFLPAIVPDEGDVGKVLPYILSSGFVLASMVRMTVEWSSVCVLFRFFFIDPLSFVPVSDDGYDGYDG